MTIYLYYTQEREHPGLDKYQAGLMLSTFIATSYLNLCLGT